MSEPYIVDGEKRYLLKENWDVLIILDACRFDYFEVEKQIESAYRRKVWMKSGAYLIFDETEALIAIDVSLGLRLGQ